MKDDIHLLIASDDTEVQIYHYDGWKFQESKLDFTADAFSSGVTSMRVYTDIIENTNTLGNFWKCLEQFLMRISEKEV